MSWLDGKRVVITRALDQSASLLAELEARGAEPVCFPTIATEPVEESAEIDAALRALATYAWVVFTSVNGVRYFLDRWDAGRTPWPAAVRVAAVGTATARVLGARGVEVDAMPDEFVGEAVPAVMGDLARRRVLLPRGDVGRDAIVNALAECGAEVHDLTVYRTTLAAPDAAAYAELERGADAVTFTSPSTLRNFLTLAGDRVRTLLDQAVVACVGPVTTEAARAEGVRVDVQPEEYTTAAMVEALDRYAVVSA